MGKYMKKTITKSVMASMEIPISYTGVRTRAKTLALQLQQLQSHNKPTATASFAEPITDQSSYLQIQSCRLLNLKSLQQNHNTIAESDSCPNFSSMGCSKSKLGFEKVNKGCDGIDNGFEIGDFDGSFTENDLDFESVKSRASRESTPCSTPGSTIRSPLHMSLSHRGIQNVVQQIMPTASDLEEFFTFAEQQQQRLFTDKYNFDVSSERPAPGRYEWVQVKL